MALCSYSTPARNLGFFAPARRAAAKNVAIGLRLGRSSLARAALRNDSLPKKKHQQTEDLLAELEDEIQPFLELQRESAMRLRTMKHYEIMYLVHEAKVGELKEIVDKFTGFVKEKKGRIWRFNDWGMRRLAYKIKKTWHANYILMNIEVGSEYINELNALLEKDERIIRHMIITRKKAISKKTVPPEELPPSRAELLEKELAAETAAEEAAEKEEKEARVAKRKARREEAAAAAAKAKDEVKEDEVEVGEEDDDDLEDLDLSALKEEDEIEDEEDEIEDEDHEEDFDDDEDDSEEDSEVEDDDEEENEDSAKAQPNQNPRKR
ncbi:glutamic acid-rich protein [Selaginella moellendorffii]|uniref:glutamic acid-rich protein n=1 Tax=Selaginella moellendorffii TaxID=88036 RepID=UPI000D1CFCBD|nr:glutamic acid-rich protein [Selaginella moellendorffii]|eukprot:XP_002965585.2 glutamic acid-rich protein [Selaginella moellendorffii]